MLKRRAFRPSALSQLEDRVVLSHIGLARPALVHHIQPIMPAATAQVLSLNGSISGTFVTTRSLVGGAVSGTTTTFQGSGTISGLGAVQVSGSLSTVLSVAGQKSSVETFTLTTSKGSVTIELSKSAPAPGKPGTVESSFAIVNATGAFAGDKGAGIADLQMINEQVVVVPPTVTRGVFTLTLHSNPPIL
jgi:hypothetical protein